MNKRKIYFYCALILTVSAIILLGTGSSLLTIPIDRRESIPFGTLITWTGMISLPFTIYWGIKEMRRPSSKLNRILSGFLKIIIVLGILWVPISYLLAGNLSFSFSDKDTFQGGPDAMRWFWRLNYGIGTGAILTVAAYWISLFFIKDKNDTNNA